MAKPYEFPDRRDQLFGRKEDIAYLLDRVKHPGLTVIHARPRMGKTWLLEEVGRRLLKEKQALVGYYEVKGSEDVFLHSVADLYTRWISSAGWKAQVKSLKKRYQGRLIPRAVKAVVNVTERLTDSIPIARDVVGLFADAFRGFSKAQEDLLTGGLELKPLAYDQANELVRLMADIDNKERPILLVLDAWEKTQYLDEQHMMLSTFLSRIEDWPRCHVVLSIRKPDRDFPEKSDKAFHVATALVKSQTACARSRELHPMVLDKSSTSNVVKKIRSLFNQPFEVEDKQLLALLDAYPAVLENWIRAGKRHDLNSYEDLARYADEAQQYRFSELDRYLPNLNENQERLVIRLAFLPRMDERTWLLIQDIVIDNIPQKSWQKLFEIGLLERDDYPSLGHDTRHEATAKWYLAEENRKIPVVRPEIEQCILSLSTRIGKIDETDRHYGEALFYLGFKSIPLLTNRSCRTIIRAIAGLFGALKATERVDYLDNVRATIKQFSETAPLLTSSLIGRGIKWGQQGDSEREISEYTTVIGMDETPLEQRARALLNRGIAWGEKKETEKAITDFTIVLGMVEISPELLANALHNRALTWGECGETDKEIADYTAIIEMDEAPLKYWIEAFYNRGVTWGEKGETDNAISDYTFILTIADTPIETMVKAYINRGSSWEKKGEIEKAIADYTAVIVMDNVSVYQRAEALSKRGIAFGEKGEADKEIADYTAVIEMDNATIDQRAMALNNRGFAWALHHEEYEKAIADFTTVIVMDDAPEDLRISSLHSRGLTWAQHDESEKAIDDFTAVIEMDYVSAEQRADSLNHRGLIWEHQQEYEKAIADFTSVVEMDGAPTELIAEALTMRGDIWDDQENTDNAISDYSTVIEMKEAPIEQLAKCLVKRGHILDKDESIADFTQIIDMKDAPTRNLANAFIGRGVTYMEQRNFVKGHQDISLGLELAIEHGFDDLRQAAEELLQEHCQSEDSEE